MESKKKILFINGHLNAGGCERSLVNVLHHLNYEEYAADLLLLEEKGSFLYNSSLGNSEKEG